MTKQSSSDLKLKAVEYYYKVNNYSHVCKIFDCSERSLKRWIKRYEELEEIKRLNRKPKSYKITKEQVKYAIQKLKENERCKLKTLFLIYNLLHKKYQRFFL